MKWKNKGREFDEIGFLFKDIRRVYLYGAGKLGAKCHKTLTACNRWNRWELVFVDRNERLQDSGYLGARVISPAALLMEYGEDGVIVVCAGGTYAKEMNRVLTEAGLTQEKDFFAGERFLEFYLPIHLVYCHDVVYFSSINLLPSTVCNLNCSACLNFKPYIKKHVVDSIESLMQDVDALFAAVDLVDLFHITGGEPFLYPGFAEIARYISERYGDQIVSLTTTSNGTIPPSAEIAAMLKERNIFVFVDDYSARIKDGPDKLAAVKQALEEAGVSYQVFRAEAWIDTAPLSTDNSALSEQEMAEYFTRCAVPWTNLRKRQLSACNYAHYAAKAGICPDAPDEYFDLNSLSDKKELVEFRLGYCERGYVNFCRQCAGYLPINPNIVKPALQADG